MLIAVDIDSTLHPYWDVLSAAARRRFGVELPYEEQLTWGITRLCPEQLAAVVADTHEEKQVLSAEPYEGAVDVLARWGAAGHRLLIVSHRTPLAHSATERWLQRIGVEYEELHCSDDKIARCLEVEAELLIDDSPINMQRALDLGMRVATIAHPWNRDICQDEDVICAASWPELERHLAPVIASGAG